MGEAPAGPASQESESRWQDSPICDRLRLSLEKWCSITNNNVVLSWIRYGVPYEFPNGHPPPFRGQEYELTADLAAIRNEEFERFRRIGAIQPLPADQIKSATFNGVFIVSQRNKDRPVVDQRYPNSFQQKIHFKMDSIKDVRDLLRPKEFMIKIDLKDAYLHMKYRRCHWKYGAFWWNKEPWCFVGMMFGHTHAPRWFTKLMKPVVKYIRSLNIRCVIYLDDLLVFCGRDFAEASRIAMFVRNLLLDLGLTLNCKKSIFVPVRRLVYLGYVINSKSMTISVDSDKLKALRKEVRKLKNRGRASARELSRILGKITAMSNAILPWRLRTRATLLSKNQAIRSRLGWDHPFPLSRPVLDELKFWLTEVQNWNGKPIHEPEPSWTTTSDSSSMGFGGSSQLTLVAHSWEPQLQGRHSTVLESIAAARVIKEVIISEDLRDGTLLHQSDNTTAVSYLTKQGGKISEISEQIEELWDFCLERGITLRAKYLPGSQLPEVDFLSRMKTNDSELMLPKVEFDKISALWGMPEVDLFATRFNCQMVTFVSLFPDPSALATDAFTLKWSQMDLLYAFPPFNQIGRVLAKLREEGGQMVLVTPDWQGATWGPDIAMLTIAPPLLLSNTLQDFDQQARLLKWNLLAWRLSARACASAGTRNV